MNWGRKKAYFFFLIFHVCIHTVYATHYFLCLFKINKAYFSGFTRISFLDNLHEQNINFSLFLPSESTLFVQQGGKNRQNCAIETKLNSCVVFTAENRRKTNKKVCWNRYTVILAQPPTTKLIMSRFKTVKNPNSNTFFSNIWKTNKNISTRS